MATTKQKSADYLWNIPAKTNDHRQLTLNETLRQKEQKVRAVLRFLVEKTEKDEKFIYAKSGANQVTSPLIKFRKLIAYCEHIGLVYR
jgi:uncharacterized protein YfbU (UPF0304 family)